MKDADILKFDMPKPNQPVDYYQNFLQHIDPMVTLFEIRLGFLRWLQGTCLKEAISSRKVKHGQYGRLLVLLEMSRTMAYNCRVISRKIPERNARRLGYSEMLRLCGLLNDSETEVDSYDDDDKDDGFDLTLSDDDDFDEGEAPLPAITYNNFLPKLAHVRNTLEAIAQMDYAAESREEAVQRYLEASKYVQAIKRHCSKVEKLIASSCCTASDRLRA